MGIYSEQSNSNIWDCVTLKMLLDKFPLYIYQIEGQNYTILHHNIGL